MGLEVYKKWYFWVIAFVILFLNPYSNFSFSEGIGLALGGIVGALVVSWIISYIINWIVKKVKKN